MRELLSIKKTDSEKNTLNSFEWYDHNTISENCRQFSKFTNEKSLLTKRLIEILNPNHNDSILDIGCGEGHLLMDMATITKQSTGIEPDTKMMKLAKYNLKGTNVQLIQTKFENYESNRKFTIVTASHVFSFFRDKESAINKIINLTEKNGKIAIVLHSSRDDQLHLLSQVNSRLGKLHDHITTEALFSYLKEAGWKPKFEELETSIILNDFNDVLKLSYFLFRIKPTEINRENSQMLKTIIDQYQKNEKITLTTIHGIIVLQNPSG